MQIFDQTQNEFVEPGTNKIRSLIIHLGLVLANLTVFASAFAVAKCHLLTLLRHKPTFRAAQWVS